MTLQIKKTQRPDWLFFLSSSSSLLTAAYTPQASHLVDLQQVDFFQTSVHREKSLRFINIPYIQQERDHTVWDLSDC